MAGFIIENKLENLQREEILEGKSLVQFRLAAYPV
jgi:hypothetical protein